MAIIWDKQPEPDYAPVVAEEEITITIDDWLDEVERGVDAAVEEIIAEAEQSKELAKEVEAAKGFYKGFGK
jgi:hypothetical protein